MLYIHAYTTILISTNEQYLQSINQTKMITRGMIINFPEKISDDLAIRKMKINRGRTKSDKITKEELVIMLCEEGLKKQ